jgi:hypothetical protein
MQTQSITDMDASQSSRSVEQLEKRAMVPFKHVGAAELDRLSEVAVVSLNDLLRSSVLTNTVDRKEMRELRKLLKEDDTTTRWNALQALVELTEDMCKTCPQMLEHINLSLFDALRTSLEGVTPSEVVPSFGFEGSPRDFDFNGTPRGTPREQVFFLETPRDARVVLGKGLAATPREKATDTPRFGCDECDMLLDDFFADRERPSPIVEKLQNRFASAPAGFDARRRQNGRMVFCVSREFRRAGLSAPS